MSEEGAAIIDVGGESTRPGAKPVWERDEIERIEGVVAGQGDRVVEHVDDPVPAEEVRRVAALVLQDPLVAHRVEGELGAGVHGEHRRVGRAGQPAPEHVVRRRGQVRGGGDRSGAGLEDGAGHRRDGRRRTFQRCSVTGCPDRWALRH